MVHKDIKPSPARLYCWEHLYFDGGRCEGFKYALEVNCNLDALKKKLEDKNEFLFAERRGTGDLAPNASPRHVAEGFVSALEEIIAVVNHEVESANADQQS